MDGTSETSSLLNGVQLDRSAREKNAQTEEATTTTIHVMFPCIMIVLIFASFFIVPPGKIGIVVTLGHLTSFGNGLHFRIPFVSTLDIFSAKTQKLEEQNITPTKEGLNVQLDTVVLFRVNQDMVEDLYTNVGVAYIHTMMQPEVNAAVRCYTSENEAKELYTSGRRDIQDKLKANLAEKLEPRGIIVEDVLLKDLQLPEMLAQSIELKLETEQEAEQMVFVLEKERFEAQRKTIEAEGIANFQHIVSEGISSQLLQWKGIEATERLARSPNSKIIVMGNGHNGLPVLLSAGGGDSDIHASAIGSTGPGVVEQHYDSHDNGQHDNSAADEG